MATIRGATEKGIQYAKIKRQNREEFITQDDQVHEHKESQAIFHEKRVAKTALLPLANDLNVVGIVGHKSSFFVHTFRGFVTSIYTRFQAVCFHFRDCPLLSLLY